MDGEPKHAKYYMYMPSFCDEIELTTKYLWGFYFQWNILWFDLFNSTYIYKTQMHGKNVQHK